MPVLLDTPKKTPKNQRLDNQVYFFRYPSGRLLQFKTPEYSLMQNNFITLQILLVLA
jgi:hypothetical protein